MRVREWIFAVVALVIPSSRALAQDAAPFKHMGADAHPGFAVATIKPHDPASQRQGFSSNSDRVNIRNESVVAMITFAYSINKEQVLNAPLGRPRQSAN